LFGVTKSPNDLVGSILPPNTLFLVLEYAKLGTLRAYLKDRLNGSSSDWKVMYEVIMGLSLGLKDIHEAGFIHRDVHWDNLLVTRRATPNDPEVLDQLVVLVSDLGEARQISSIDTWVGGRSYNNHEFRAPSPFDINTQPADIWTVGYLIMRMTMMHWDLAAAHGNIDRDIPDCFRELIDKCLVDDPTAVPTAGWIVSFCEDYGIDHWSEEDEIAFTMVPYEGTVVTSGASVNAAAEQDDEIPY